ncbi:hypothetical protein FHU41_002710 [Psychromicrobium silvestre]|uniref:Uncharacterized protein n=1 Tax=Psychromicrobium silvestre TaxID=1645614 RepID=A0A7Y9LVN4_9MICC|nr:hypothetical protein [Psychromicrobium silvestre]NYE96460.1 hypothetical protein [Psychromicrobium silvestre]
MNGPELDKLISKSLDRFTAAIILAPPQGKSVIEVDNTSRLIEMNHSDTVAENVMKRLALCGMETLIVEDDIPVRNDSSLGEIAYLDETVIRWRSFSDSPKDLVTLMREGATGYPMVAYVSNVSSEELKIESGVTITVDQQSKISATIQAVIVTIYDAEAFLMLGQQSTISKVIQC